MYVILLLTWIGKIKPGHCIKHVQSGVSAGEIGGVFVVDDDSWGYDVSDRQNVAENPTQSHTKNNLKTQNEMLHSEIYAIHEFMYEVLNEKFKYNVGLMKAV